MSSATPQERLARDDARARRSARRVFDRPLVLEAGAGTGKTTALVTRVLAWCLGPGWERAEAWLREQDPKPPAPERIARRLLPRVVAITFTEAAAAEMGQRVAEALLAVEADQPPDWLPQDVLPERPEPCRGRAAALRGAIDLLVVQTIHAYCRRLLVTHPLEAGLHPYLEIDAEGRLQAEVVREVLEERLSRAYTEGGEPEYLALAQHDLGPPQLEQQLLGLLEAGAPARALQADPLAPPQIAALQRRTRRALEAFREATGGCFHRASQTPTAQRVAKLVDATVERLGDPPWRDASQLEAALAWLAEQWEAGPRTRLKCWGRGEFKPTEARGIDGNADAVAAASAALAALLAHLGSIDLGRLELGRRLLGGLLADVETRLRARGVATFSALLTETRDLLQRRPDVAARVRGRIDQLLVDEFQDTDRRQCEILRALALSGPAEARPGLFLVGDPKQSIYGWRSADLAAYDAFVKEVETSGGRREQLSVNYRSAPALLDEVERVMEPVMVGREGVQPPFRRLVPAPQTAGKPGFARERFAPTEYWVSVEWDPEAQAPRQTRASEASRLEARALARDLRALHQEHGVAWNEIGVLFRSRGDLEIYLGALRSAEIPYAVEGDRSYYQRREIIEAAALVRCVLDPNDRMALLAWLRSAAVGVPDAALIPLWARDFAPRFGALSHPSPQALAELRGELREVVDSLPPVPGLDRIRGWEQNLVAAVEALAQLRESFRNDPVDVFVERLRTLTLFETTEAARYLGAWRTANLDRFFRDLARQLDEGVGPHTVLRRLRRSVGQEEQQEEGRPKHVSEDAVQVMTIHGAKGLDFEHVYVMQLHKGSGRSDHRDVQCGEVDGVVHYRLLGVPTPGWDLVERDRDAVAEAERVRTLYVAMTRAKQRLVLAGLWPGQQLRGGSGEAIKLLQQRREGRPELDATMAECAALGPDFVDAASTRWVFPALAAQGAARRPLERRRPAPLPAPEQLATQAEALRAARQRARAHAARAFGGTASAAAHEERLAERAERRFGEPSGALAAQPSGDEVARSVGTAIHRILEDFDLDADPETELARQQTALETLLAGAAESALDQARELLARIAAGRLLARLRGLAREIRHRELPVLAPPELETGPTGYVSGVVDLVYRDPETDELVIADYKTDRLDDEALLAERSVAYRRQGAVYQRALRDALGLAYTPRFELWYLHPDQVRE